MNLQGKTIIITGASQGLGKALAKKTAALQATVVILARNEKLLKEIKATIEKHNGRAEYFVCDIRDLQQVNETIQKISKEFPTIDVVINNAGIWTDNDLEQTDPNRRKHALETNVLGHIQITNALLPLFKKQNKGYIFNVISTAGLDDTAAADNTAWQTYGASKWAMTGFTKALRESLAGTNIKVTAFHPGGFESNLYENASRQNAHNQPWMMKTEDIADIVIFALTRPDDVLMEKIVVTKKM